MSGAAWVGLKCESLQKTGSFKARGALNAVKQLSAAERERGVIAVSAGNHAQGLAWAAALEDVRCTVVMPAAASETKAEASQAYGATVLRHGSNAEAFDRMEALAAEHGYTIIHPFDNLAVITGAATVGLEILADAVDVDIIVVPIGGGGLIAGIASAVKQLRPDVQVIGVEPQGARSMYDSLEAGHPMKASRLDTIADGLASPYAGELTFPIVRDLVDDVVLVTDAEIAQAMSTLLSRTKLLAEGAGATAMAALLSGRIAGRADRRVLVVLSGGNIDTARLCSLL